VIRRASRAAAIEIIAAASALSVQLSDPDGWSHGRPASQFEHPTVRQRPWRPVWEGCSPSIIP
jgi:hypothetical protein